MNRIEIKADGPVEVEVNGEPWCRAKAYMLSEARRRGTWMDGSWDTNQPDRITITLTEREAELVMELCGCVLPGVVDSHTLLIGGALATLGFRYGYREFPEIGSTVEGRYNSSPNPYAHAERTRKLYTNDYEIRLTMDRDVAVTLTHLLECVKPIGELGGVLIRLLGTEKGRYGYPPRFTGTIRWKKRRLKTDELRVGSTYKLLTMSGARGYEEWEPVE